MQSSRSSGDHSMRARAIFDDHLADTIGFIRLPSRDWAFLFTALISVMACFRRAMAFEHANRRPRRAGRRPSNLCCSLPRYPTVPWPRRPIFAGSGTSSASPVSL